MGLFEQFKHCVIYLFEKAFGWQKEEIEWKNHLLIDDNEKDKVNVPFHYIPMVNISFPDYEAEMGEVPPTKKRVRKPKEKVTDSKTEKKVSTKTSKPKEVVVEKKKTTRQRKPKAVE